MVLRVAELSPLRHGRRVRHRPDGAGRAVTRRGRLRARGLPRHPGHHCPSLCPRRGPGRGPRRAGPGWCGCAVGLCDVQLARRAVLYIIATVRSGEDETEASRAGVHEVIRMDGVPIEEVVGRIRSFAPGGGDHIVEVAFDANIAADAAVLAQDRSVAAYARMEQNPPVPFWPLVFKNIRVVFLGSDDFPPEAKFAAVRNLKAVLAAK